MSKRLSKPQIEMLKLHLGTTSANTRRNPCNGTYFHEIHFPTNPTAMSLDRRGLMNWRGYNGETRGGWFITTEGETALRALTIAPPQVSES